MPSQHPLPSLDWGTSKNETNDADGAYHGTAVGQGPHSEIMEPTSTPVAPFNRSTQPSDTAILGVSPQGTPKVAIDGFVFTRQVPTQSAGSRTITLPAAGQAIKVSGNDPRRANMTIIGTGSYYLASNHMQVEQQVAGLIPANIAVVLTHRDEVWVAGPTGGTFPMNLTILTENWAY
jgi:hypothetical protein